MSLPPIFGLGSYYRKKKTQMSLKNAWAPENSRSDHTYIKNSWVKPHFKTIMYNCGVGS